MRWDDEGEKTAREAAREEEDGAGGGGGRGGGGCGGAGCNQKTRTPHGDVGNYNFFK